jgi:hypothetical protein
MRRRRLRAVFPFAAARRALPRVDEECLSGRPETPPSQPAETLRVNFEALPQEDQSRFLDLAVIPQDADIPEDWLRVLWRLSESDTRECMARLTAGSVAHRVPGAHGGLSFRVHDPQRDLLRTRRRDDLPRLHERLLLGWRDLHRLPNGPRKVVWPERRHGCGGFPGGQTRCPERRRCRSGGGRGGTWLWRAWAAFQRLPRFAMLR